MNERYTKFNETLIYDTETNRIIRNPLVILESESYLLIDIVDDYISHFVQSQDNPIKHRILLKYDVTKEDIDLIINNLNAYNYFMKIKDFDSMQYHVKHAIGILVDEEEKPDSNEISDVLNDVVDNVTTDTIENEDKEEI